MLSQIIQVYQNKRIKKRDENGIKSPDSRDCWPMNSNDSAWLDPLHLPRAPILQHNVSLCHGRTTPLLSPSVMPAASLAAWSRVYGILDFGNPNGTAECRSRARRSSIGEETYRGKVERDGFSTCIFSLLLSQDGCCRSSVFLYSVFWIKRANPWCNLGWVVKILSLLWCPRYSIQAARRHASGNNDPQW